MDHANLTLHLQEETARLERVLIGRITAIDENGAPRLDYPGSPSDRQPARSLVPVDKGGIGKEVALAFENGDIARPLILGLIQPPAPSVTIDGEKKEITAEKEIVLRCGKASITLTREGRIIVRGAQILSRSSGVNRIKGGSVQIN